MTRLRLGLLDPSLVREEELKALPAVLGVVEDDTYQIVLGPGTVARVTPEFEALVASAPGTAEDLADRGAAIKAARSARNSTPFKLFLRRIANIFVPLIPALIGCGIIAGLNGVLTNMGWLPAVVPALAAMAAGFMSLIAVFVGYNTAKEFGGTPVLGGAVAAIIVFPGIANIEAFGHKLSPARAECWAHSARRSSRCTSRSGAGAGSPRPWTSWSHRPSPSWSPDWSPSSA